MEKRCNLVKKNCNVINGLNIGGIIGVVIGGFLPFFGYRKFSGSFTSNSFYELYIDMFETEYFFRATGLFLAFIVTLATAKAFSKATTMATSITMLIAAVVGGLIILSIRRMVYEESYSLLEVSTGFFLIAVSYICFIIAAIMAIIADREMSQRKSKPWLVEGNKLCPRCGNVLPKDNSFCGVCGLKMIKPVCPKCGAEKRGNSQFCYSCGENFSPDNMKKALDSGYEMARTWICPSCNEMNSQASRYCEKCGWSRK